MRPGPHAAVLDDAVDAVTAQSVVNLIATEVTMLDDRHYAAWLDLFAEECTYWIPVGTGFDLDPSKRVSIIYDDRARLGDRVWRLTSGQAHGQNPPSRTVRVLGTVRISSSTEYRAEAVANFILAEFRQDVQQMFAGTYRYVVLLNREPLMLESKRVDLINSEGALENLAFLL